MYHRYKGILSVEAKSTIQNCMPKICNLNLEYFEGSDDADLCQCSYKCFPELLQTYGAS